MTQNNHNKHMEKFIIEGKRKSLEAAWRWDNTVQWAIRQKRQQLERLFQHQPQQPHSNP